MRSERIEQLRRDAQAAVARVHREQADVSTSTCARAGDLFLFRLRQALPVEWLAVLEHKDDSRLWYVVAADQNPLVGSTDIELPHSARGAPLVLRCAIGLWVHESDFERQNRVGSIDMEHVEAARDCLAAMVRREESAIADRESVDADPDYAEWIDEICAAVSELEEHLHSRNRGEPHVVSFASFHANWHDQMSFTQNREAALAADSLGISGATPGESPPGVVINIEVPGRLAVISYKSHVCLVYVPDDEQDTPPTLDWARGVDVESGGWQPTPDGAFMWSQVIPIMAGSVEFSLAGVSVSIES